MVYHSQWTAEEGSDSHLTAGHGTLQSGLYKMLEILKNSEVQSYSVRNRR